MICQCSRDGKLCSKEERVNMSINIIIISSFFMKIFDYGPALRPNKRQDGGHRSREKTRKATIYGSLMPGCKSSPVERTA